MGHVVEWGRFVLATVFLLAGVAKLGDRAAFADAVRGYRLAPPWLERPIARWLPIAELAAAALLFAGLLTAVVAAALAGLLTVFAAAVALNLVRGRRISCGCFGATVERELTWWTVARNVAFVALAVVVATGTPAPGAAVAMLVAGSLTVVAGLLASAAVSLVPSARRIEAGRTPVGRTEEHAA